MLLLKNMKHRTFVAINLPERVKKELNSQQDRIESMFSGFGENLIRWTKERNLHITLVFLGYISDQELMEIFKITKEAASCHKPFFLNLTNVFYGPPKKMPPRMVWAEGEKSEELGKLQKDLENSLLDNSGLNEAKPYSPHITLGRIKTWQWKRIEPEERPEIETDISLKFPVESIEIMESQLKKGGPEYTILESIPLIT